VDRTDGLAAVLAADDLTHQNGACRPFAAKSKPHEGARDEQLLIRLSKTAQEGENREPQDSDLQRSDSSKPIGQHSSKPAAERGCQQRDCANEPGFGIGDGECRDDCGNCEAEDLYVEGIERPTAKAGPECAFFARR